ncbi:MAG: hypothetical protein VB877_07145, partial [Pirellulaceae bacterium]
MLAFDLVARVDFEEGMCCLTFLGLCFWLFGYVLRKMTGAGSTVCGGCQYRNRSKGPFCSQCGRYLNASGVDADVEKDRQFSRKLIAWKKQGRLPEEMFQALVKLHREDKGLEQAVAESPENTAGSEVAPQTTAGEFVVVPMPPLTP